MKEKESKPSDVKLYYLYYGILPQLKKKWNSWLAV